MFTGLIEEIGIIRGINKTGEGLSLVINAKRVVQNTAIGDSISVDGACLTVTGITNESFTAFASRITSGITTIGGFKPGRRVNLERALSMQSRLGGHIVHGHVDCRGQITGLKKDQNGIEIVVTMPNESAKYLVNKAPIAIDGISLTVVGTEGNQATIYAIPETLSKTVLGEKIRGSEVNIEIDILSKYVEKFISSKSGGADSRLKGKLAEEGFI